MPTLLSNRSGQEEHRSALNSKVLREGLHPPQG